MIRFVYYTLIGVVVVGTLGGYLNFLVDRDSKMIQHFEQNTLYTK